MFSISTGTLPHPCGPGEGNELKELDLVLYHQKGRAGRRCHSSSSRHTLPINLGRSNRAEVLPVPHCCCGGKRNETCTSKTAAHILATLLLRICVFVVLHFEPPSVSRFGHGLASRLLNRRASPNHKSAAIRELRLEVPPLSILILAHG